MPDWTLGSSSRDRVDAAAVVLLRRARSEILRELRMYVCEFVGYEIWSETQESSLLNLLRLIALEDGDLSYDSLKSVGTGMYKDTF